MELLIATLLFGIALILGAVAYNYYLLPHYNQKKQEVAARERADEEYRIATAKRKAEYALVIEKEQREIAERKAKEAIARAEAKKAKLVEEFNQKKRQEEREQMTLTQKIQSDKANRVVKNLEIKQNLESRMVVEKPKHNASLHQILGQAGPYLPNELPRNVVRLNEDGQWESVSLAELLKKHN